MPGITRIAFSFYKHHILEYLSSSLKILTLLALKIKLIALDITEKVQTFSGVK